MESHCWTSSMICAATWTVALMGGFAVAAEQTSTARQEPPMVLSVSWSSPDTRYLRRHVEEWEQRPFTGTLVHASWPQPEAGSVEMCSGKDSLSWAAFHRGVRFTPEMIDRAIQDLRETPFTRPQDNFLWVVTYLRSGHFDWFDDAAWTDVRYNIASLARLAREGGLRGLVLDCEEYGCPFWSYGGSRPDYALKDFDTYQGKSWEETRNQVRRRGQDFIQAINREFPGCLMWLTYGYSHIVHKLPPDVPDLSDVNNGLLAAFLDGMLEASDAATVFIDGGEGAYRFSVPEEFMGLRKVITETALDYTLVPDIYRRKMRVGFGLYLDMFNYSASHPWYSDRPEDNYMTPARLEQALKNALQISDGYVWIYSEYPSWWLEGPTDYFGEGVRTRQERDHRWIPRVYWQAMERALGNEG